MVVREVPVVGGVLVVGVLVVGVLVVGVLVVGMLDGRVPVVGVLVGGTVAGGAVVGRMPIGWEMGAERLWSDGGRVPHRGHQRRGSTAGELGSARLGSGYEELIDEPVSRVGVFRRA